MAAADIWSANVHAGERMSGFSDGKEGDERGGDAKSRSPAFGGESGHSSGFGRRKELPYPDLTRVLSSESSGASRRTSRAVSPPLAD